jgi:hypothetical protein
MKIKLFLLSFVFFSYQTFGQHAKLDSLALKSIVSNYPSTIDSNKNNVQVIVGNVTKDSKGNKRIVYVNLDSNSTSYFYPASCVKLPVVIIALEWLNEHKKDGVLINSEFELKSNYSCHSFTSLSDDKDDLLTIENCIKKILLVSDNRSYNALFDLLGRDYINLKLKEKGYIKSQIAKSFSGCADSILSIKPSVRFFNKKSETLFSLDSIIYNNPINKLTIDARVGDSLMIDSVTTITGAKDFSMNNYLPLDEGLDMLVQLIYPSKSPTWHITTKQRKFLMYWMSRYPKESKLTTYTSNQQYFDAYKKYLIYGRTEMDIKSDSLRIYNIVGLAYGFATDIAYLKSTNQKVECFIAATTYSNNDGVMNDNKYDYQTIGFPFLKYLGTEIFNRLKDYKK